MAVKSRPNIKTGSAKIISPKKSPLKTKQKKTPKKRPASARKGKFSNSSKNLANADGSGQEEKQRPQKQEEPRLAMDIIPAGIFWSDPEGNILYANRKFQELFGYTAEDIPTIAAWHSLAYPDPAYREEMTSSLLDLLSGKNKATEYIDVSITCKDGSIRHAYQSCARASDRILAIYFDITERKNSEKFIRQSEERYRSIIEQMADGYFETDLNGKFTFVNDAECRLLGYKKEELIGKNNLFYADEKSAKEIHRFFVDICKTGKAVKSHELHFAKKDGNRVIHDVSISLLRDTQGKPAGFRGIARDITERKQMEEALRQSEERYRSTIETIQDGYFEIDLAGKYTFVNDIICQHLKYSREELIGTDNRAYQTPEEAKKTYFAFRQVYETGIPNKALEMEIIRKDGTTGVFEVSISLIMDSSGVPIGFRGISRDITKRKQMENLLKESEEKYRTILEEMNDGYFEVDLTGKYTFVTETNARLLATTPEKLLGKDSSEYMVKEDIPLVRGAFNKIYKTGKPERNITYRALHKDGTISIAELSGFPRKDEKGNIIGFRGIARDITERKQMEEALRQSEEKYRNILQSIQEGYFELDLAGNYTFVNDANCRLLGYSRDEIIGMNARQHMPHEDNYKKVSQAYTELFLTGKPIESLEIFSVKKDGTPIIYETSVTLIKNAQGKAIGFRGVSRDITERKRMEEQIRQSEERYRSIIENMTDGYFEVDLYGNFTYFNDAQCRNLGYTCEELIGMNRHQYADEKNVKALFRLFNNVYKTGIPVKTHEVELIKKDGAIAYNEISVNLIRNKNGEAIGFRGISRDITERKRQQEKIHYLATHDSLTGLPNRMMLNQLLSHAINAAKRHNRKLAVFFIDLDRFKIINDMLGHEAGDRLLQEIALRFRHALRSMDIVARMGGDEFVVLIEEIENCEQISTVAHKLMAEAAKPFSLMSEEFRVTASIGISIYPKDGETEQSLMKNADIAMYFAKEEGKNNFQFYSKDIKSHSIEKLSIETQLRFALERNELFLMYQAKVDFKTALITGVEALLRWNNPALGAITPLQFIPVAEETGLIVPIGRWVLNTACGQNIAWQKEGLPPVCTSVNLSLRQLLDEHLLYDIENALKNSGLSPSLLELEITESMVMHNPGRMISILGKIKELGVRLAIDNFGTGYSSLAQLKHLPVNTLKVDRSIIHNVPEKTEDKAIAEAIIAMGKTLSLKVVTEGVETKEQMEFLRQLPCDEMQGFYFSKPLMPDKFANLLSRNNSR
jgi:diguanylate cyclase (GGDEF)-like protein/PAS domain S-box-containing protein